MVCRHARAQNTKKKWYGMSADIRENTENRPTE
jgi:hypothetical protein